MMFLPVSEISLSSYMLKLSIIIVFLMSGSSFKTNTVSILSKLLPMKMFSGIVEEIGNVDSIEFNKIIKMWDGTVSEGVELSIKANKVLGDAYIGCSISVNGVCLTATSYDSEKFTTGIAPETLRKTNLGKLKTGSPVNLERALKADGRNSGHVVQGHVDNTGTIIQKWRENDSLWIKVKVSEDLMKYIVPKGFICIDGTSLTICDVNYVKSFFTFMLVRHTQDNVIIPLKDIGEEVNVEVDVLAKMVESSIQNAIQAKLDSNASIVNDNINVKSSYIVTLEERIAALEKVVEELRNQNISK